MSEEIQLGELYRPEELPENEMNHSGKPEWVADEYAAIVLDGDSYEFHVYDRMKIRRPGRLENDYTDRLYRCVRVVRFNEDAEIVDRESIGGVPEDP